MMSHPDRAALEGYVLGHHEAIDLAEIESHLQGCDGCLDQVGREARLEMLLHAAGAEDAFAAVLVPRRRRRWPLAAAAAAVAVTAGAIYLLWPTPAPTMSSASALAQGVELGTALCSGRGRDLTCTASAVEATRERAEALASDIATEALLELALQRGGPAIRAQRAVYAASRAAALKSDNGEETRRRRHEIASRARLGRRDTWYWEEFEKLDGRGSEFRVFVRFTASEKEIAELLARYRTGTVEGAELVPIVPSVRWALDPGDDMAWFVHRPGQLSELGIRARDVLLMNQRWNANAMRALVESDRVQVWRRGLERPVPPSTLR